MMPTIQTLQLLIFMLLGVTSSLSSTLLLPLKQRYSSLGIAENNINSTPQFFSPNKVEAQLQTPLLSRKRDNSFLLGKSRKNVIEKWGEDAILGLLLMAVVRQELRHCDLVVACSAALCWSTVLHTLLTLPNVRQVRNPFTNTFINPKYWLVEKLFTDNYDSFLCWQHLMLLISALHLLPSLWQVVQVSSAKDLMAIDWVPNMCGGYLMLLEHIEPLFVLATSHHHSWDYAGRYSACSSPRIITSQVVSQYNYLNTSPQPSHVEDQLLWHCQSLRLKYNIVTV